MVRLSAPTGSAMLYPTISGVWVVAMRPPAGVPALSRRTRILLVLGGIALAVLLAGTRLLGFYVNWLWFGEVGYRGVFSTIVLTRIVQFVLVALVFAVLIAGTLAV